MKNAAIGFVLGLLVAGAVCAYNTLSRIAMPSVLAPPSKELAKEETNVLDCQKVAVFRPKVKDNLNLPDTVKKDPDKKVVASSPVPPSDHPHTMTAVYDSGTGGVDMFLRQDPLVWLAFNRKGAIGAAYGFKDAANGFVARVYGRLDLVQIKLLHAGLLGDVDNAGGRYGGAFAEVRW